MPDHSVDTSIRSQMHDGRLSPGGGTHRVLVQEVPPAAELHPVDLHREVEEHGPLSLSALDFSSRHPPEVEILVELAIVPARWAPDYQPRFSLLIRSLTLWRSRAVSKS